MNGAKIQIGRKQTELTGTELNKKDARLSAGTFRLLPELQGKEAVAKSKVVEAGYASGVLDIAPLEREFSTAVR